MKWDAGTGAALEGDGKLSGKNVGAVCRGQQSRQDLTGCLQNKQTNKTSQSLDGVGIPSYAA